METSSEKSTTRKFANKYVWIGLGLLILVVGFAVYTRIIMPPTPIPDILEILEDQGYSANLGFSGVFRPGNVVQIIETGPNGKDRTLLTPVLFLWGADCFPSIKPRIDPFVLPQTRGTSSALLTVGAKALAKLVPTLQLDSQAIADYRLQIENPRVHTLAKGDLSGRFSEKCVQAYDQQLSAGDKPEWFAVILDAIVAEKLAFEMEWKADTTAGMRAKVKKQAEDFLTRILKTAILGKRESGISVRLKREDREHTVISAEGAVIVGYRARPLQRQW